MATYLPPGWQVFNIKGRNRDWVIEFLSDVEYLNERAKLEELHVRIDPFLSKNGMRVFVNVSCSLQTAGLLELHGFRIEPMMKVAS